MILCRRGDNALCQVYFTTMLMSYNMELYSTYSVYGVCDQYRKVPTLFRRTRVRRVCRRLIFVFKNNIMSCVFINRGVVYHKFDQPLRFMDTLRV